MEQDRRTVEERLDDIELLLRLLVKTKHVRRRAGGKRARTVAERVAADITYQPTELQRAAARRALLKGRKQA